MLRLITQQHRQQLNIARITPRIQLQQVQSSASNEDAVSAQSTRAAREEHGASTKAARPLSAMPGPGKYLPYFGTFFTHMNADKGKSMHDWHVEWSNTYGPVYQEKLLGKVRVFVSDPHCVEEVMNADGKMPHRGTGFEVIEGIRDAKDMKNIPHGILESDGEVWKQKRRIHSKLLLRPVEIKNYFSIFSDTALEAIDAVKRERSNDNVVSDQRKLLTRWSMDSTSAFLFGKPFGFMQDPPSVDALKVDGYLDGLLTNIGAYANAPAMIKPLLAKKYREAPARKLELFSDLMIRYLEDIVDRSQAQETQQTDQASSFCDYLLGNDNLSLEECATFVTDVFAAGYETTSLTMEFFLYVMGKNPDKQELLYKEICDVMPDNGVLDYSTSQRMPYLRACIKESQRMYPLASLLARVLEKDVTLNGYVIPKDTSIMVSNVAMSKNNDVFPNAWEFQPERWLRTSDSPPHPFGFLPFGTGVRSCVGRRIAEGNLYVFAAQYFKVFQIKEVFSDLRLHLDFFLQNKNPLNLRVVDRE